MEENIKESILIKKKTNEKYLCEMQKFLDIANNIENEDFKYRIIFQVLKLDEALTDLIYDYFKSKKV